MPLSRETFNAIMKDVEKNEGCCNELPVALIEHILEQHLECDVQTLQGKPKLTVERVKGMIEEEIKTNEFIIKDDSGVVGDIAIECILCSKPTTDYCKDMVCRKCHKEESLEDCMSDVQVKRISNKLRREARLPEKK
jgi:ABC-type proline/glycine betaine transport system ATPase subunit